MECYRCHTPIPDGSRFCLSCGADVSDPSGTGTTTAAMDAAAAEQLLRLVKQEVGSEFEVERELGRGGMAIVYLATEVHLGRRVAIKVLPPDFTFASAGAIERFKREARTAATLDHPSIIPVYRVSPGGRLFWYAMKFLEGQSLADVLKEKRALSLAESIAILEQVASALDYAHARHVVHRDIKPANIMLDAQDRVIVTDFGIAKELAAGSFTASGSVIGTPYYMSPEQCAGSKTLTGAADQYAVGVMAYQMLSGQVPFEGDSAIEILTKHCTQPPPPLEVLRPGLPEQVYQAIDKALAKKPQERFPSVRAFVEGLKQRATPPTLEKPRRPSFWRRAPTVTAPGKAPRKPHARWPLMGLTLLGAAGAVVGALALWRAQRGTQPTSTSQAQSEVAPPAPAAADTAAPRTATSGPRDTMPAARRSGADSPAVSGSRRAPPTAVKQATGHLLIAGLPPEGTVSLNGQRRSGRSFELPAGTYVVGLSAPGYHSVSDTVVTVTPGQAVQLAFAGSRLARGPEAPARPPTQERPQVVQPAPAAAQAPPSAQLPRAVLVVRSVGGWARIHVDGTFKREGTSHRDTLPPGRHTLRLERQGFTTVDTAVTLQPGQELLVTVAMRSLAQSPVPAPAVPPAEAAPTQPPSPVARPAVLLIRTVGGWARIYVDNVLRREGTSHRDTLPAGTHRVRLEREGFVTVDTTVTLRPGEEQVVTISMRPGGS